MTDLKMTLSINEELRNSDLTLLKNTILKYMDMCLKATGLTGYLRFDIPEEENKKFLKYVRKVA